MKKTLTQILIVGWLTGCSATPTYINTVDPYTAAEQAKQTAESAQSKVEYYGSQLTATAQAPVMAITSTAAAFEMEIAFAKATADANQMTKAAEKTATAYSYTPTPNATMTAVFARSNAEATQIANRVELDKMKVERQRISNTFWAIILPIFLLGILLVFIYIAVTYSRVWRVRVIHRDPRGDAPLLLDVVDGMIYDADRNPSSTGGIQREHLKLLPQFSANDHIQTAARDQMLDLATRGSLHTPRRKPFPQTPNQNSVLPISTTPAIEVIDAAQAKPLFHDVVPHIIQDAIEAEIISEGDAHE